MQTKLIEILSESKDWMTAAEIADKGGWRSPANVGVALQQMEKGAGNVERRKSPTKNHGNGMPATEWKLTEKAFGESVCDQQPAKSETQRPLTATSTSASAQRSARPAAMMVLTWSASKMLPTVMVGTCTSLRMRSEKGTWNMRP